MFRLVRFLFLSAASFVAINVNGATPLLPDIIMDIKDVSQGANGATKVLRFATWTENAGVGPLELHQHTAANPDGTYDVDQWIYDDQGGHTEHLAGKFAFVSGRLRFTDSADYFLKEITQGGGVGGIVAANEKQSYCIIDSQSFATPAPPQHYTSCGPTMGITVNWADIYPASFTTTQIIPLTGVSDGIYWLENTGDPLNRLIESDDTNNTKRIQVTINTTGLAPEINVMGNGQSIANNDSTPSVSDNTDFGNVDVANDSLTRTFTIQNLGNGSLSLTGVPKVQITGSTDFAVTLQPVSPVKIDNPTTTFQITFNPSSSGLKTATVTISNNDANESSYQFTIQGQGIPDTDGDGEDDISESISGTDPNNPNSFVRSGKQLNISTRLLVQTGDNVGIGGFIISGAANKTVVLRALGPSLTALGISGALLNPTLELRDHTGAIIGFNDNWKDSQQTAIQNTGLAPSDDRESAVLQTLSPGGYTTIVRGTGGTTGVGLVEMYDVDPGGSSTVPNMSTRGFVDTGDNVMIGGVIVGSGLGANGAGSAKVLLRVLGPSLASASISNALQDPTLELRDGNGALIASNNDWRDTQESAIQATGLKPSDDHESAILAILTKGAYTAIVREKNGNAGVALIEAYKLQ